jgi:hypothetical protein
MQPLNLKLVCSLIDDVHIFLALYRGEGKYYLRYWYDRNDSSDIWLLIETSAEGIQELIDQKVGLREAGLKGSRAWLLLSPLEEEPPISGSSLSGFQILSEPQNREEYLPANGFLTEEDVRNYFELSSQEILNLRLNAT